MTDTVLDSNVSISSFAAPTEEDIATFNALSDEQKRALVDRELDKAAASGVSERSMDEIFREALKRAGRLPDHAL